MIKPERHTVLGSLSALLVAENGGDIVDEVFILCDVLGIERPECDDEFHSYKFNWDEEC